jgi:hypothetical protein
LLGVALSALAADPDADQLALFQSAVETDDETARDRALVRAVDRLRDKFGSDGIVPARLSEQER